MHSPLPLVSIITPMYRCDDTLSAALNSLSRQDEGRWESILVDDGSPDHSRAVAEAFARRDARFRVMSQRNAGACAARNTGVAAARGRYVLFLDADDWLEPGALSALLAACERRRWWAAYGGFRYARADGTLTQWHGAYAGHSPLFEALAASNVLSLPSCVMLRRSLLDEVGAFDVSLAHCGDWDLWARVARSERPVGRVDQCVTAYRMRMASLSRNALTLLRDAKEVLTRIHSVDCRVPRPQRPWAQGAERRQLTARLADFTFYAASLAAMQGNTFAAATAMDSIACWPTMSPERIAEFLIHSACFSRCVAPEDLRPLPSDLQERIDRMIADLAARTRQSSLAARVGSALAKLGFGRDQHILRDADRRRLCRPVEATETLPQAYLRSLALREFAAGA